MKFMVSIGANPIIFNLKLRRNSPLVAKGYPLSGGNSIIRSKKLMLLFFLKERTNRVSYLANFHNEMPSLYK